MFFRFKPEDLGCDMLNREQKLTVAGEKKWGVRTAKLDCDLGIGIGGERVSILASTGRTDSVAGVGLHLAVAGNDV